MYSATRVSSKYAIRPTTSTRKASARYELNGHSHMRYFSALRSVALRPARNFSCASRIITQVQIAPKVAIEVTQTKTFSGTR
ncbi:hypothetical protein D3C79_974830 [compost metagenome]